MPVFNQATALMRRFLYRFPRLRTDLPLDFILGDAVILGACIDISESGLRATFSLPVVPGSEGLVTLYRNDTAYQAHAVVESIKDDEARLRFLFLNEDERKIVRRLLQLLSQSSS